MFEVSTSSPERSSTTSELTLSLSSSDFFFFFFFSTLAFFAAGSSSSESSSESSSIVGTFFSSSSSEESSRLSSSVSKGDAERRSARGFKSTKNQSRAKKRRHPRSGAGTGAPRRARASGAETPSDGTHRTCRLELGDLTPSACRVLDGRRASEVCTPPTRFFQIEFLVFVALLVFWQLVPQRSFPRR